MPIAPILESLTGRDVDVLREAAEGLIQTEIAAALSIETKTVNKRVAALKELTGEHSVGGLGQFWRRRHIEWIEFQVRRAGTTPEQMAKEWG